MKEIIQKLLIQSAYGAGIARFCIILSTVAFCFGSVAYAQTYSPPPPYFGVNPSQSDIRAKLVAAGQKYHIPPHILFGIAESESIGGWRQFRPDGRTQYHLEPDGRVGVGIMQVTVNPSASDYQALCTKIDYNIDRGAALLGDQNDPSSKWRITPIIGDNDRTKLENWYYAIWAYNGFVAGSTYPQTVLNWIANCPNGQWVNVTITSPTAAQISGRMTIANTPSPYHVDANFDGVIDGTTGGSIDLYVDGSYSGSQSGTATNPYSTVAAAVNATNSTQAITIHIKPGVYHESLTIRKNIHMVTWGSGTVRIGN